jgi:transforming growth factor-beta-induced protein
MVDRLPTGVEVKHMMKIAFIALFIVSVLSIGMSAAEDDEAKTIVETAIEAGDFNTLVSAVDAAGLTDTLNGEGPFTVFAPTDEAFASLFASVEIDMNDIEALTEVLTYHVASGEYMAADVVNMTSIPTLQGGNLTVEVTDEGVMVNGANVTTTDILCSNGVIHVIDAVLMPPAEETVEEPVEEMTVEVEESEMPEVDPMETDEAEC